MASPFDSIKPTEEKKKKPGVKDTFKNAVLRGTDVLQANNAGALAAFADASSKASMPGMASMRDWAEGNMQSNLQEAAQYNSQAPTFHEAMDSFGSEGLAGGLENTALWAANAGGEQVPQIAQSIATYGTGKKIGDRHSKELGNLAGTAANFAGNTAQEAGSIYGDILESTGQREGGRSLGYGALAGAVDTAVEATPLGKIFGGRTGSGNIAGDMIKAGAGQLVKEAPTEYVQTGIEQAAVARTNPEDRILTPEKETERREAAAAGALVGGVTGAGSEGIGRGIDAITGRNSQQPANQPAEDFNQQESEGAYFKDENPVKAINDKVQANVQAAASADPNAGIISRAANLGAKTGAVAEKAVETATQEAVQKTEQKPEEVSEGLTRLINDMPAISEALGGALGSLNTRLIAEQYGITKEEADKAVIDHASRNRKPDNETLQAASQDRQESQQESQQAGVAAQAASPVANVERPPASTEEVDAGRQSGSMSFEQGSPRQIPDSLVDADPSVKRGWYHGWDMANSRQPKQKEKSDTNDEMQNRDRSSLSSQAQLSGIAMKPDYDRVSQSKTPANGAPMAYMTGDEWDTLPAVGNEETVTGSDGRKIQSRYAVVEAGMLQPSSDVFGNLNKSYNEQLQPGVLRALNNGRTAGLKAAYDNLTADEYRAALTADAEKLGVDRGTIESMDAPILIRVYSEKDNVGDMGAWSNISDGLRLSPAEQAKTDARMLGDLHDIKLNDEGDFDPKANMDLVHRFVNSLPETEAAGLRKKNGEPNVPLVADRLRNAMLVTAYGDDDLVNTATEAKDDAKNLITALSGASAKYSTIPSDDPVGVKKLVVRASQMFRKAKSEGTTVEQLGRQVDIAGGFTPEEEAVAEYIEQNIKSAKRVARVLKWLGEYSRQAEASAGSMFGDDLPATKEAAIAFANQQIAEEMGDDARSIRQQEGESTGAGKAQGAHEGGASGAGSSSPEGFALESYTNEEIAAREAEAKAAAEAAAAAEKAAENKAKADAEAGQLTLTGSDRTADVAAAAGQNDMFGAKQPDLLTLNPDQNKDIVDQWRPLRDELKGYLGRFYALGGIHSKDSKAKLPLLRRAETVFDGINNSIETGTDLAEMPQIDEAKKFISNVKAAIEKSEVTRSNSDAVKPELEKRSAEKSDRLKSEGSFAKKAAIEDLLRDMDPSGVAYARELGVDFEQAIQDDAEQNRLFLNSHDIYDRTERHKLPPGTDMPAKTSTDWSIYFSALATVKKPDGRKDMARAYGQVALFEQERLGSDRGQKAWDEERATNPDGKFGKKSRPQKAQDAIDTIKGVLGDKNDGGDSLPATVQQLFAHNELDSRKFPVDSMEDARDKWNEFVGKSEGGVSQIGNGLTITDQDGNEVGRISYNGRIWDANGKPVMPQKKSGIATAPEHTNLEENAGVSVKEMEQIAKAFRDHVDSGGDADITHAFDAPAKDEIVRLNDKARVHVSGKGWMTPEEAKAEIQKWKDNASKQGEKSKNSDKVVLSLFDLSGEWSKPWEEAGYQVYRFDIQNGETYEDADGNEKKAGDINNLDFEYFADMFGYFNGNDVHAILAASPCTDFAVSGARHFAAKDADGRTVASIKLVKQTLNLIEHFKPAVWALENPVGRIEKLTGLPPWRLSFDPNHLGDTYTKKTLIWGRFNADLPVAPVEATEGSKMHKQYGGKSQATKNARSVTPEGFAYAFFQANNAIDHPVMAIANKYDMMDRDVFEKAIDAGMTDKDISEVIDDYYYMDQDWKGAEDALLDAIEEKNDPTLNAPDDTEALEDPDAWRNTKSGVMFKARDLGIENPQRAMVDPLGVIAEIDAKLGKKPEAKDDKPKDKLPKAHLVDGVYYNDKKKKPWMTKGRAETVLNSRNLDREWHIVPAPKGARGWIIKKKSSVYISAGYYDGEYTHKSGHISRIIRPSADQLIDSETAKHHNEVAMQYGGKFRSGDAKTHEGSKIDGGFFEFDTKEKVSAFAEFGIKNGKRLGGGAEFEQSPMEKKSKAKPAKAADAINTIKGILGDDNKIGEDKPSYGEKDGGLSGEQKAQLGQAALQLAEYYFDSGLTKFSDFARQMLNDIGSDKIKPFIEAAYMGGRANLRQTDKDLYAKTDKVDTVEALVDSGFLDDMKGKDILGADAEDTQDDGDIQSEKPSLKDFVIERMDDIKDNNGLKKILAEYHGQPATEAQIKEGQEAFELGLVLRARDVVADDDDMQTTFNELLEIYNSQPLLNSRSSTSMENQAYSTPLPLAYLAGKLAGIDASAIVYEPTAGNGALVMAATPENTHTNELNDSRRAALESQGFVVTGDDATGVIALGVVNNGGADSVVMNPPFGALDGGARTIDGYSIGKIDHLIAMRALKNMKDNGRAVMIIGANKEAGAISRQDRIFFNWLYGHYNVVDHFEVDGKMYSRQGAGWPVAVITIDGRKSSDRVSPKENEIVRIGNWEQVYEHTEQTLDSIGQEPSDRNAGSTVSSGTQQTGLFDTPEPSRGETKPTGKGVRSGAGRGRSGSSSQGSGDNTGGSAGVEPGQAGSDAGGKRSGADGDQRDGSGSDNARPDGEGGDSGAIQKYDPSRSNAGNSPSRNVKGSGFQAAYVSGSKLTDDGALVPVNMQPAIEYAIEALQKAVGGDIDSYVMEKLKYTSQDEYEKAFMGLQADTIAAAIYNMEVKGKGIIIADQTGVGKGRQGAGIIRWAIKNGKIPVFITVKPNLFTDIYDDSMDIGLREISPFIMNKDGADIQKNGRALFSMTTKQKTDAIRSIANTGKLPDKANALFMTYSQITSSDAIQRDALTKLVAENGDKVVFILDESHNVAGDREKRKKVKAGGSLVVKTGAGFINDIISGAPVTYLSATYAKRPDNMPVYHRTDLMDAVDSVDDLINAASRGGEALQTVIANALARNGQLWRREKSYEGIEIKTIVESKSRLEHERLSDKVTNALKTIIDADNILSEWLEQGGSDAVLEHAGITSGSASHFGGAVEQHASHSPFTSIVHNYVRQMLLGLKAEWIVEEAIALKKAGKKPIVALENTMESFLKDAIESGDTKVGDTWDGDFSMILQKALKRTARVTVEGNNGEKIRIPVPQSLMPPVVQSAYKMAMRTIDAMDVSGIPIMPIDYIRHKLEQNGISTGEITGRSLFLDYSGGVPVVSRRSEIDMNRRGSVDRFNAGDIDAIILNSAGSTGLSIHARKDYGDLRPRHMLVAQPMLDINIMMQMLGRINRTGQVVLPEYSLMGLDLPAEKRPLAITNRKMASLNANTSANTKSDTSLNAPDIMNKYGARVISDFLMDNMDIAMAINVSPDAGEDAGADFAIKATGRFALLPVETQRYAYDEIERSYADLIAFLDATGQNDLKTETYDLNASIIDTTEVYEGKFPGTQLGGNAYLHHVSVNKLGSPPAPADVLAKINASLGGKTPGDLVDAMISESAKQHDKILNESIEASITLMVEKYEAAKDDKERELIQARLAKLHESKAAAVAAADETASMLRKLTIGTGVKLDIGDDVVTGVVVNVVKKYKEGVGSPWAASKYDVIFAVNSTAQYVTMPLSNMRISAGKLEWSGEPSRDRVSAPVEEIFKPSSFSTATERRYIATGNLVGAFAKLPGGRVINFTAANGKQYQGILMPRKFGEKEMQLVSGAPKSVRDASLLAKYLKDLERDSILADLGIFSGGNMVRIAPAKKGDGYTVTIPSRADTNGDKIKFDKDLHALMGGEFTGRGKYMVANVSDAAIERVVGRIAETVSLSVPSIGLNNLDRVSGGSKKPPAKSFDMEGLDTDGVAYSKPFRADEGQSALERKAFGDMDDEQREPAPYARSEPSDSVTVVEGKDTRDGSPYWNVKVKPRLGNHYSVVSSMAKKHDGFWSRFIKGFKFSSAESANKFADEARSYISDSGIKESEAGYSVEERRRKNKDQGDLFARPSSRRASGARREKEEQVDMFNMPPPENDPVAQVRDNLFVKIVSQAIGHVSVGVETVNNRHEAAHVFAPFRKHAQETMLVLVLDKDGKPLQIIRHSKGAKDNATVTPAEIVGAVASIDGAASLWLGHNHPSGIALPSEADRRITAKIARVLEGTGIELKGHVVLGDRKTAAIYTDPASMVAIDDIAEGSARYRPAARTKGKIQITERVIRKRLPSEAIMLTSPSDARSAMKDISAPDAVILLDTQHRVIGNLHMTVAEMLDLKNSGQVNRLWRAIDSTNANAIMVKVTSESGSKALEAANNVNAFINNSSDVRFLDSFIDDGSGSLLSIAEKGMTATKDTFFRKKGDSAGVTREQAQKAVDAFMADFRGARNLDVVIYDNAEQAFGRKQMESRKLLKSRIAGAYRNGRVVLFLDGNDSASDVTNTLRHEIWTHYGFDLVPAIVKQRTLSQIKDLISQSGELYDQYEQVKAMYRYDNGTLPGEATLIEELVARLAEKYGDKIHKAATDDTLLGIVRRIFDAIMNALRSAGYLSQKDGVDRAVDMLTGVARNLHKGAGWQTHNNASVEMASRGQDSWYFSPLQRAVADMRQEKGTPDQMLAILAKTPGVKQTEIEATGLPEYLAMHGKSVTKQQILDFVNTNGVRVQESMLGGDNTSANDRKRAKLAEDLRNQFGYSLDTDMGNEGVIVDEDGDVVEYDDMPEQAQELLNELVELYDDDATPIASLNTKFHNWQLPGGENYRELLLTLPAAEGDSFSGYVTFKNENDVEDFLVNVQDVQGFEDLDYGRDDGDDKRVHFEGFTAGNLADLKYHSDKLQGNVQTKTSSGGIAFRSNHFDTPNILAHVRFNERTDAEGKKVLFIEEIQSDWAQVGRKEGFRREIDDSAYDPGFGRNVTIASRLQQAKEIEENLPALRAEAEKFMRGIYNDLGIEIEKNERAQSTLADETKWASFQQNMVTDRESPIAKYLSSVGLAKMWRKEAEGIRSARQKEQESLPPSAPFVTSTDAWVSLAMKRMIAYAAENGFDRIAWTTGEQQADRYDLSRQVDNVEAYKNDDGTYDFEVWKDGKQIEEGNSVPESKLESFFGKELASKIINEEGEYHKLNGFRSYKGADLKVGGQGMKSFYNNIVPKVAKEVTKKMGGKLSTINFDDGGKKSTLTKDEIKDAAIRYMNGDISGDDFIEYTGLRITEEELDDAIGGERDSSRFESQAEIFAENVYKYEQGEIKQQPGFDITPEMRDAVEGGLPLFSRKWQDSLFDDFEDQPEASYSIDSSKSPLHKSRTREDVNAVTAADFARAVATNKQAEKIVSRGDKPDAGQIVGLRLHIGITNATKVPVLTIHKGGAKIREKMEKPGNESGFYSGTVITYSPVAVVKNAYLTVSQKAREAIASGETTKEPMASVDGEWVETSNPSFDGVLVRFNPKKDHLFIDQKGRAVKWAEEATVMGHRAYLRGRIEYYSDADAPTKVGSAPSDAVIYDPAVPPESMNDLFFRRAAEGDASAVDVLKTNIQDRFAKDLHTFGFWHKSVGTQYHKAWKDRDYKSVFDQAQFYLNDTNRFAMEAADLAPKLLPSVESFADVFKKGASKADIEAIAAPIYKGTLEYIRDTDTGRARRTRDYEDGGSEEGGIVFTPAELRSIFNLNDGQIELYNEFRSSVDHSLNAMTASEIAQEIKDDPGLHGLVMMAKYKPEAALDIVVSELEERAVTLKELAARIPETDKRAKKEAELAAVQMRKALSTVRDKLARLQDLKVRGYAPLMRFGKYTVTVKNAENGAIEYFSMFETQHEARAMERAMQQAWGSEAEVSSGVMSQEAFKLYAGMDPSTLELFGSAIGFDKSQSNVFQDYLRLSRNNRSALKRLIRRQGIAGYSTDVTRSLASFITSNARQASSNWHMGEMNERIEKIRAEKKHKGDVIDEAVKLADYLRNPQEEAAGLRNLLFINFIGGSIASAITNMTQPVMMTAPYLSQYGSATKYLVSAGKIGVGQKPDGELGSAMQRAIDEGLLAPHEVYQLHAEAIRGLGSNLYWRKVITAWGRPFALAEAFNRRLTFAAAYNMAKDDPDVIKKAGSRSAYGFAVKAVQETQGIYNKGNRPNWARGAVGATVFTFKQYSIGYLEFVRRLPRKQQLQALGLLFLMAGVQGLPFVDDIEDIIDTIAQGLGYNLHSRSALRKLAIETLGATFGEFIANGASAMPGSPIDVQARMGLGSLIPGTGILKRSTNDKSRDITDALGAVGGLARQVGNSVTRVMAGDLVGAGKALLPVAARNALIGLDMGQTGKYRDAQGRLISKDVTTGEAAWKSIGFNPSRIASESRNVQGERQRIALARQTEGYIADRWAEAIVENDTDKRVEAQAALREWNRVNPATPIRISPAQIRARVKAMNQTRMQRFIKSAPKEMRQNVRKELEG